MAKRTKFSRFRDLYEVIEELVVSYTYEGVVEILAEHHDLILTTGTLTNYLYRYRKESKELSAATDNSSGKVEIKHVVNKKTLVDSKCSEPIQESDVNASDKPYIPPTIEELDAAIEEMKRKHELKEHRSLFDRR